jgi:hypothetical protein
VRNTWFCGGSVLVRRRIQTPSVVKVRSAVQLEGEVVLGASPPARRIISFLYLSADAVSVPALLEGGWGRLELKTAARAKPVRPLMSSPQAATTRPACEGWVGETCPRGKHLDEAGLADGFLAADEPVASGGAGGRPRTGGSSCGSRVSHSPRPGCGSSRRTSRGEVAGRRSARSVSCKPRGGRTW